MNFINFFIFAEHFGTEARAQLLALAHQRLGLQEALRLDPSFPNPFNATTIIPYALARPGRVELAIYDIRGQKVRTLVEGLAAAGVHRAIWDGTDSAGRRLASALISCGCGRPNRFKCAK